MRVRQAARESDAAIQAGLDAIRRADEGAGRIPGRRAGRRRRGGPARPIRHRPRRPHDRGVPHARPGSRRPTSTRRSRSRSPAGRTSADIVLHYTIADVGFFVDHGGPIDAEAWRRGGTVYLPGASVPLYPTVLCEGAASLLPDGPRPAVVFTVRIDHDGNAGLDGAERAVIHSRAKLAYDAVNRRTCRPGSRSCRSASSPPRTAAMRPGRVPRAGVGTRRRPLGAAVRPPPRERRPERGHVAGDEPRRRRCAVRREDGAVPRDGRCPGRGPSAGCATSPRRSTWSGHRTCRSPTSSARWRATTRRRTRSCSRCGARAAAPRTRRSREGRKPWHSAMAATYAHATAPLRRLADRYVVEAALAVANSEPVPDDVAVRFDALPR